MSVVIIIPVQYDPVRPCTTLARTTLARPCVVYEILAPRCTWTQHWTVEGSEPDQKVTIKYMFIIIYCLLCRLCMLCQCIVTWNEKNNIIDVKQLLANTYDSSDLRHAAEVT